MNSRGTLDAWVKIVKLFLIILLDFVSGIIILMYGVQLMNSGLEKSNLAAIRKVLSTITGRLFYAFLAGIGITALVQSSTAVTVLTVSFVNSRLIQLPQAIGIIYGANIGTTITAQLMSFKMAKLALPLIFAGLVFLFISKKPQTKHLAKAISGLGLMFLGIGILSSGAPLIKDSPVAYNLFKMYGVNPFLGLILGMITTMLVHSSSATVGLTIILFNAGLINFDAAIGLTMGDNIGTCITAQLASLGTCNAARRTAWAHTLYNVIGVLVVFAFFKPFAAIVEHVTYLTGQTSERLVANTHTIFNILSAVVFLPLTKPYIKFIQWLVPEKAGRYKKYT